MRHATMASGLRFLAHRPETWLRYGKFALKPSHCISLESTGGKFFANRIGSTTNSRMIPARLASRSLVSMNNFLHGTRSAGLSTRIGNSIINVRPRCQPGPGTRTYQLISLRCYSDFRPRPGDELAKTWKLSIPNSPTIIIALVVIMSAIVLPFYEQVPYTGRWRFMGVPLAWEAAVGKREYEAFLKDYRERILPPSHPVTQQISIIASTILEANGLGVLKTRSIPGSNQQEADSKNTGPESDLWDPDASRTDADFISATAEDKDLSSVSPSGALREWNLIVVDDDKTINAMAGSGNIIVFTGILRVAPDENALAAVIGHEIAHVVARHVSEKLSRQFAANALLFLLDVAGLSFGLNDLFMELVYHLPNSRTAELEADKIGIHFAAQACFDPRAAVDMQTRLMNLEKSGGKKKLNLSFLHTHPSGNSRIRLLTSALPEAYSVRAASGACAQLQDDFDAFRTAAEKARVSQETELAE